MLCNVGIVDIKYNFSVLECDTKLGSVPFSQLKDALVWIYFLDEFFKTPICNMNLNLFLCPSMRLEGNAILLKEKSGFLAIERCGESA